MYTSNANACVLVYRVITGAWYDTNTNISTTTTITATADVFMKKVTFSIHDIHAWPTPAPHGMREGS